MLDQSRDDLRAAPPGEGLWARRDRLYARLTAGWARIDDIEATGGDAGSLVDFWLELLREYERVCDRIAAEASEGSAGVDTASGGAATE